MPRHVIVNDRLAPPRANFSQAVCAGNLVFLSGVAALDPPQKHVVGVGDASAQAERIMDELSNMLAAIGAGWGDLVRLNSFIADIERDLEPVRAVQRAYVAPPYPACGWLGAAGLVERDFLAVVDAIAAVGESPPRPVMATGARADWPPAGAVAANGLLFMSGQTGTALDVAGQTEAALAKVEALLAAADLGWGDILRWTVYVVDFRRNVEVVRSILASVIGEPAPIVAVVGVPGLSDPESLVLVEALASAPTTERTWFGGSLAAGPAGRSARAVRVGSLVIAAGRAMDAAGGGAADAAQRADEVLADLGSALAEAGADWSDLVRWDSFVVDIRQNLRYLSAAKLRVVSKPYPASVTMGVSALAHEDLPFEVHAFAWV